MDVQNTLTMHRAIHLLARLDITPSLNGWAYMSSIICELAHHYHSIEGTVYDSTAQLYQTTPRHVRQCVCNAIRHAYRFRPAELMTLIDLEDAGVCPKPSTVLIRLAERLREQCK